MSARNNSKVAPKRFCKVCHDAGKSEKEYTSHFVKSEPGPNGKVVCPTLLAQECRFCFEAGHTAGYCPVIAANKKAEEKALRLAARKEAVEKTPAPKPVVAKKATNVFAALESDSDSDEPVSKKVSTIKSTKIATVAKPATQAAKPAAKEEFPALPSKPKAAAAVTTMSGYASVAAKMPDQYASEKYEQELIAKSMKHQMPPVKKIQVVQQVVQEYDSDDSWEEAAAAVAPKPQMKASLMDWAATYDSDDEDW
jgi:hypothetical protein